jgi:hypothetical protein
VAEAPNVSDSALRRRRERVHMSVASRNNDHNLRFASQSRRHQQARLRAKPTAREKERKAIMVSLAGRHKEVERLLLAGHHKEVARPLQPNAARDSHNTERKREKKNHHRQAHNNFGAICDSGSGKKNPEPIFML